MHLIIYETLAEHRTFDNSFGVHVVCNMYP